MTSFIISRQVEIRTYLFFNARNREINFCWQAVDISNQMYNIWIWPMFLFYFIPVSSSSVAKKSDVNCYSWSLHFRNMKQIINHLKDINFAHLKYPSIFFPFLVSKLYRSNGCKLYSCFYSLLSLSRFFFSFLFLLFFFFNFFFPIFFYITCSKLYRSNSYFSHETCYSICM